MDIAKHKVILDLLTEKKQNNKIRAVYVLTAAPYFIDFRMDSSLVEIVKKLTPELRTIYGCDLGLCKFNKIFKEYLYIEHTDRGECVKIDMLRYYKAQNQKFKEIMEMDVSDAEKLAKIQLMLNINVGPL